MTGPAIRTTCCIAGGGPAGMMLGLLLARAGIEVVVMEKHDDFLRDFRGDTLHPSTLQVLDELGILNELLTLPHQKVEEISAEIGDELVTVADFRRLAVACPAIVLMPQWDFLDFLRRKAEAYPNFRCLMGCDARDIVLRDGRVRGVGAIHDGGPITVEADLVIVADGRRSRMREAAGLEVETLGAPIDVMWFRVARLPTDTSATGGRFDAGRIFVRLYRGDYWQCGYVIAKGKAEAIEAEGIEAFRCEIASLGRWDVGRLQADLPDFEAVSVLSVAVDRLRQWWRPGLLCIGDAAHAMSPVGGVGINLAIQDAVAAGNILAGPLKAGELGDHDLATVQRRRNLPTKLTQAAQIFAQDRILAPTLRRGAGQNRLPLPLRLVRRYPVLRRIPARLIGMGVRPEHVRSGSDLSG